MAVPGRARGPHRVPVKAMATLDLFSPAKINLFLRVTRKRPDGFHDLASVFQAVSFGDTLGFDPLPASATSDTLTVSGDPELEALPTDDSNLVIKALNVFRERTGSQTRYAVHLTKRIPTGAGLGGGSGNAATALWAANELSGRPAGTDALVDWAADVGSDVPFFLSTGTAMVTGRGENVEAMPSLPPAAMLLVKPPEGVPTPEIFKRFSLENASDADPEALRREIERGVYVDGTTVNDLEAPAFAYLPKLGDLKARLAEAGRQEGLGYTSVFMSGSGATIVCLGADGVPELVRQDPELFRTPATFLNRPDDAWYADPNET